MSHSRTHLTALIFAFSGKRGRFSESVGRAQGKKETAHFCFLPFSEKRGELFYKMLKQLVKKTQKFAIYNLNNNPSAMKIKTREARRGRGEENRERENTQRNMKQKETETGLIRLIFTHNALYQRRGVKSRAIYHN